MLFRSVAAFGQRGLLAREVYLYRKRARLISAGQLLNAFSYRAVLQRGFALVRDAKGFPLHETTSVTPGMQLDIEFSDGRVGATADGSSRRSKSRGGPTGQGSLFG